MRSITPRQLSNRLHESEGELAAPLLVDVREPWEWNLCHIPGSIHVPMHLIPLRMDELDPAREIVCICHHGARSAQVVQYLSGRGYDQVINLHGGVAEWANVVDPSMPRY